MTIRNIDADLRYIREASALIPILEAADIKRALEHSAATVAQEREERFFQAVTSAFHTYCQEKLWEPIRSKPAPSEIEKALIGIEKKAEKLLGALNDASGDLASRKATGQLLRVADRHARDRGGFSEFPAFEFGDPGNNALFGFVDFRVDEKLLQIIEGVELLKKWAEVARKQQREIIEKGKAERKSKTNSTNPTRQRDSVYIALIGDINGAWIDAVEKLPGVSRPGGGIEPGGPYVDFLSSLFETLRSAADPRVEEYSPGFLESLERSRESLSHAFRATGISRLRGIAPSG